MIHRRRILGGVGMFLVLVALSPSPASAGACLSEVVEKDSPHGFIVSVADALSYTKQGQDRNDKAVADPKMTPFDLLLAIKLGKADFECARSKVVPFASSTKETIQTGATGVADALTTLIEVKELGAMTVRKLLDEDKVKLGTANEMAADLAVMQEQAWHQLILAVVASTYAVVEVEPTTGKMSRLALTRKQRDEITRKLVSAFGPGVKVGMKAGQKLLMSAAAALYQVVADPRRTSRPA